MFFGIHGEDRGEVHCHFPTIFHLPFISSHELLARLISYHPSSGIIYREFLALFTHGRLIETGGGASAIELSVAPKASAIELP
jgi:hypothetical protein